MYTFSAVINKPWLLIKKEFLHLLIVQLIIGSKNSPYFQFD